MPKQRTKIILTFILLITLTCLALGCTKKIYPPPAQQQDVAARDTPKPPPAGDAKPATQRQYTVLGQTFTPLDSHEGYMEEGIASWYGPKFHGQKTSNGEVFNMYEMTAAHRVLPMNTKIRVTNLENGKTVQLRINDRGPFVKDRIIDLSFAAAREIGMLGPGTAMVRVEAVGMRTKAQIYGAFYIQVGSFSSMDNARKLREDLQKMGYSETRLQEFSRNSKQLWRVQAGEFSNLQAAEEAHSRLSVENPGAFIIAD